jgi:hypothetical protein
LFIFQFFESIFGSIKNAQPVVLNQNFVIEFFDQILEKTTKAFIEEVK